MDAFGTGRHGAPGAVDAFGTGRHGAPGPVGEGVVALAQGAPVGFGATRWSPEVPRTLGAAVRVVWLLGVVVYLGLVRGSTAPYTAAALAGIVVLLGAYARLTGWRPAGADRAPLVWTAAAAALLAVVIPATMAGLLDVARVAVVAAVTGATIAALTLRRP